MRAIAKSSGGPIRAHVHGRSAVLHCKPAGSNTDVCRGNRVAVPSRCRAGRLLFVVRLIRINRNKTTE
jgi:hypothetical protein